MDAKAKKEELETRGFGRVFKRGRIWWIAYSVNGKEFRESSRSQVKSDATALLKRRHREAAEVHQHGLTLGQALDHYLSCVMLAGRKRMPRLVRMYRPRLLAFFGNRAVEKISVVDIRRYQAKRVEEGRSPATVNMEVSVLRSAIGRAVRDGLLRTFPGFPEPLPKPSPRQGFFEHDEYLAIRAHLPGWAQDVLDFAYYTGWRRNEVLGLTWEEVSFRDRRIRLKSARSKNGRSRVRPIMYDIGPIMERRRRLRRLDCPFVFHRDGRRIPNSTWNKYWGMARRLAGLPGRILHDTRRTAVRNLVRAGVPEKTAMAMTGHLTRSVFDRYNIICDDDLVDAATKLKSYIEQRDAERKNGSLFDKRS